jgi:hypothetical protein
VDVVIQRNRALLAATIVSWYPWLSDRYVQVSEERLDPARLPGARLERPIYLVDDTVGSRVARMSEMLGPGYRLTESKGPGWGERP